MYERSEEVLKALLLYKRKYSEKNLYDSLKYFVTTHLNGHSPELFQHYTHQRYENFPGKETIARALGQRAGTVERQVYSKLSQLFDYYLLQYKKDLSTDTSTTDRKLLSPEIASILCKRVNGICSNPTCHKPTSAPLISAPEGYVELGRACYIHGPTSFDPRYDPALHLEEISGVENGIWLCNYHAELINADRGTDYSAETLKSWKREHEQIIKQWSEGKRTLFFVLTLNDEVNVCRDIITFFDREGDFLLQGTDFEETGTFAVYEAKQFLLVKKKLVIGTELEAIIDSICRVLEYFHFRLQTLKDHETLSHLQGATRKVLGLSFMKMNHEYNIALPVNISRLVPQVFYQRPTR